MLVTFEAETRGTEKVLGLDKYDVVVPEVSLLAEFPVTVVDKVVDKRGSRKIAEAYLDYLYSPEGRKSWPRTSTACMTRTSSQSTRISTLMCAL